jgi:hypothetical protein
MNGDPSQTSAGSLIARRILDREAASDGHATSAAVAGALQQVCLRTAANLRDAMGVGGCEALLARAVARAVETHPALEDICRRSAANIQIDDLLAAIEARGVVATTTAVEALLGALIDILSRLIGEDMAIRLIDPDVPRPRPNAGARRS